MKNVNIEIAESYVLSLKNEDLSRAPLATDPAQSVILAFFPPSCETFSKKVPQTDSAGNRVHGFGGENS